MRISDWSSDVCSSDLFKYANAMQVPRLEKVVVNMGVGEAVGDSKKVMAAVGDLTAITGQKPVVTRAKKAIANFKLRDRTRVGQGKSVSVSVDTGGRRTLKEHKVKEKNEHM